MTFPSPKPKKSDDEPNSVLPAGAWKTADRKSSGLNVKPASVYGLEGDTFLMAFVTPSNLIVSAFAWPNAPKTKQIARMSLIVHSVQTPVVRARPLCMQRQEPQQLPGSWDGGIRRAN
jgi:hypothetical protein